MHLDVVRELVQLGEERLAEMLKPRPAGVYLSVAEALKGQASTGNYRRNLQTRVEGLHGRIDDGGVIYGPWLEAGRDGTRFRGYASFRRTGQFLEDKRRDVMEAHALRFAKKMNR